MLARFPQALQRLICGNIDDDSDVNAPEFAEQQWVGLRDAMISLDMFTPVLLTSNFPSIDEKKYKDVLHAMTVGFVNNVEFHFRRAVKDHTWFGAVIHNNEKKTVSPAKSHVAGAGARAPRHRYDCGRDGHAKAYRCDALSDVREAGAGEA